MLRPKRLQEIRFEIFLSFVYPQFIHLEQKISEGRNPLVSVWWSGDAGGDRDGVRMAGGCPSHGGRARSGDDPAGIGGMLPVGGGYMHLL